MNAKELNPKEYIRPMPATWWLHNTQLKLFMLREFTSVFVAGYAVFLMVLISEMDDPQDFAAILRSPGALFFQIIALPFVLFHSVTWFNLTPKAVVLFRGEDRVSPVLIAGAHYAMSVVASAVILWVVLNRQ